MAQRTRADTGALSGSIDTKYWNHGNSGLESSFNLSVLHSGERKILEPLRADDMLLCTGERSAKESGESGAHEAVSMDSRTRCDRERTVPSLCLYVVAQLCLTLCDPVDCNPPGFSVHGDSPGKNT